MSDNPYPNASNTMNYELHTAWDEGYAEGFAAGRAAATPDPPTDERRPWPIAPDTVMPPRRQPVRWGSRADDPPTEIHDDPGKTKAYLAGLAAGRTEAAVASPDERLREALELIRAHARLDLTERGIAEAERYAVIADDALTGSDLLASSTAEKLASPRKHSASASDPMPLCDCEFCARPLRDHEEETR